MPKALINVCCPGRSGSTVVDLVLGNADNAFSLGEVYALFRPFRTHHFTIRCSCENNPCPHWEKIRHFKEAEFHAKSFDALEVEYLIDSSKNLCWIIDNNRWLSSKNIKVYNLLLYKHPLDYVYSHWKRKRTLAFAINLYKKYYSRFFEANIPYGTIQLTDFANAPKSLLLAVEKMTGLKYFEGKEVFSSKQHHHLFGSAGTRRQAESSYGVMKKSESDFMPEFKQMIPELKDRFARDMALQNILRILDSNQILKNLTEPHSGKILRPYWYYIDRLVKGIRRRFPQKFDDCWNNEQRSA